MRRTSCVVAVLLAGAVLRAGDPPAGGGGAAFLPAGLARLGSGRLMADAPAPAPTAPAEPLPTPPAPPTAPILQNWTIGGYAEASWEYNFNRPSPNVTPPVAGLPNAKENSLRVFDVNHDDFNINAVELSVEKSATETSWVGFKAVVLAGEDAKWMHSLGLFDLGTGPAGGGGEDIDLVDAFMTIKIPDRIFPFSTVFKVGKFETTLGSEVIHGPYNLNYSRSYLFGFAIPLTHTGINIDTTWVKRGDTEALGTGIGLVNGWDDVKDNNDAKTLMTQLRVNPCDEFQANAALIAGPEQKLNVSNWRGVLDLTATLTPWGNRKTGDPMAGFRGLSFSGNFDYGWEDHASNRDGGYATWYGMAGYIKYIPQIEALQKWFLGLRGEWFDDTDGARTGSSIVGIAADANYFELTGTLGWRPWDSLLLRLEYRYDKSNEQVFLRRGGDLDEHMNTVAVDAVVFY